MNCVVDGACPLWAQDRVFELLAKVTGVDTMFLQIDISINNYMTKLSTSNMTGKLYENQRIKGIEMRGSGFDHEWNVYENDYLTIYLP